ncbi:MAG: hypothetical protein GF364_04410, partial [Candidatus Lokiarchaeota archaeon]|nr:hypothetical protein [Candidatus Lokiarchaeota archaeon]
MRKKPMFEDVAKKVKKKKAEPLRDQMEEALPQIYNALHPSVTSMATEMRIQ